MKASEIRIGNYAKNENSNIVEMCATRILKFSEGKIKYEPIPLTEEWLLKFGFIYTEIHVGFNQFRKGILELSITPNGYEIFFSYKWIKIEYVHQLQNLYFALTNEELTYEQQK